MLLGIEGTSAGLRLTPVASDQALRWRRQTVWSLYSVVVWLRNSLGPLRLWNGAARSAQPRDRTAAEWAALRSQTVTLKAGRGQHRKYPPYAFTEASARSITCTPASAAYKLTRRRYRRRHSPRDDARQRAGRGMRNQHAARHRAARGSTETRACRR
jgi:hypothetical protein